MHNKKIKNIPQLIIFMYPKLQILYWACTALSLGFNIKATKFINEYVLDILFLFLISSIFYVYNKKLQ